MFNTSSRVELPVAAAMVPYYSVSDSNGSHFMPGLNSVFIKKWGKKVTFRGTKREKRIRIRCCVPHPLLAVGGG